MRNEKISDIFDYGDEIVTVETVEYFDPAEIKELTMKKIHGETPTYTTRAHRPRRAMRFALAAAIIAALLMGTALAAYYYNMYYDMRDHTLSDEVLFTSDDNSSVYAYSTTGGKPVETDTSDETHFLELTDNTVAFSADSGSSEYLAAQEWFTYFFYDSENDIPEEPLSDHREELLSQDHPAQLYCAGWKLMAEKLQSIADKYDLRLYQSKEDFADFDSFYAAIGTEPFARLSAVYDDFECNGEVYDEGSFELMAVCIPVTMDGTEQSIAISIFRNAKGTLPGTFTYGDDPALYTCESYATQSGLSADLSLGDHYSMIFVELDGCYVTVAVNGGQRENMVYLPTIDMEVLRQIADSIDFSVLDIQ